MRVFLFKKDGEKLTLTPYDHAEYFDLSHRDIAEGVRTDISLALTQIGIKTYTSHHEVANGQHEINFHYSDALTTADRVISLKYITKVIASKHGLHASFMPKPLQGFNGSGMHTHMSLFSLDGKNAFYDSEKRDKLSDTCMMFIGGLMKYVREITCVLNSTVNSFKRLIPGYEAPTYIAWAHRNRSALIRIPAVTWGGARIELRSPDLSGNPYLQFAAMLAAGLKGIEEKIMPPRAVERNICALSEKEREKYGIKSLPENLRDAIALMEESDLLKDLLGKQIFENFLYVKRREWEDYRTQVTKWEIDRYLPVL